MTPFTISYDQCCHPDCLAGLIAKPKSENDGYDIELLNCSNDSQQKHKLHSLSQIALYQYEDEELNTNTMLGSCTITGHNFIHEFDKGIVVVQIGNNRIELFSHQAVDTKKALYNAYRYCTRWIRLDI